MKVFIIKNKISEDVYVVKNKRNFCKQFNLTPRLLDYTVKGSSANRYQPWHKNFQIVEKLNFIDSKNGDMILWDSGLKGYCIRDNDTYFSNKCQSVNNDLKKENEMLQKELNKVLKQKQKLQDQLNINRKLGREQYRYENLLDSIKDNFKEVVETGVPSYKNKYVKKSEETAVLVLSDLHFGEIVEEINNSFNLEIAEQRLGKIFDKFKYETDLRGITDVQLFLLGDFIFSANPVSRPDMKASSILPEINAGIHCFKVLASMIDSLVEKYTVTISGVVGNESRFHNGINMSTLKNEARNNVDTMIYEMLSQRYRNMSNVKFTNKGDSLEEIVDVRGYKFLLVHGHQKYIKHSQLDKSFIEIKARLEQFVGDIHYMCLGHIHSTNITDRVFRNSSLVGSNSYSNELGFSKSYVSQNMLIVSKHSVVCFAINI